MKHRHLSFGLLSIAKASLSAGALLALVGLLGCSSSQPSAGQQAALARTELHFDLNACQTIQPGLYKCPASDKAICSPDYAGDVECVRLGPKGSVYVESGAPE